MKNFLLAFILGTLPFLATGKPIPAITDSLGNRIYNLNAITIISNPKWDSKLFEFPGSISYLNTGNLDEMNIRSVKDISTVVPNLFIPDYGSKLISSAYIRGIGSRINSPAVGLYVNNIPYLDKSAFDFDFIDIASIEVLKGPQGTLYGRNTMAGLVNIKTLSPLEKQGSKIKLSFGNYNLWGVAATTSQKLTDDFAFSINARYRQDDGYFKNEYTRKNSGSTRSGGGRVQLDWRVNRHWKLSLSGDYEGSDQQGYPYAGYDKTLKKTGSISYNDEASYRRDIFTSGLSVNISTTDSSSHRRRVTNSSTTICIWTKTLLPSPYLHYNKNKKCCGFTGICRQIAQRQTLGVGRRLIRVLSTNPYERPGRFQTRRDRFAHHQTDQRPTGSSQTEPCISGNARYYNRYR